MSFIRFAILGFMLALTFSTVSAQEAPKADSSPNVPPATIPESETGLQNQLERILDLEKKGNGKEVEAAINELELPEDAGWFTQVFGPELGAKLAASYKLSWDKYRDSIASQFRSETSDKESSVRVTGYPDSSGHTSDFIASHVISDMNTPTPLYVASTVNTNGRSAHLPGFYVYAQGAFRIVNLQTFYGLPSVRPLRIRVGGNVAQTQLVYQVPPVYPPLAKTAHIQGTVVFHALIGCDGIVTNLDYVSGPPLLMTAAFDAVKRWRYKPTVLNGDPVEMDTTVSVAFTLGNR